MGWFQPARHITNWTRGSLSTGSFSYVVPSYSLAPPSTTCRGHKGLVMLLLSSRIPTTPIPATYSGLGKHMAGVTARVSMKLTGKLFRKKPQKCTAPGDDSLPVSPLWGLEAAGGRPGVETAVVNVPQVHAHQPEPHCRILYGRELQLHVEVDCHKHVCHIA